MLLRVKTSSSSSHLDMLLKQLASLARLVVGFASSMAQKKQWDLEQCDSLGILFLVSSWDDELGF